MNAILKNDMTELLSLPLPIEEINNKTILVTGATGLIARYFCFYLLELVAEKGMNINVVALARNKSKAEQIFSDYLDIPNLDFIFQDVCDPIIYEGKVDYIFHAAGGASPHFIKNDPTGVIRANTVGVMQVLEFAKEKQVTKVLFPSTREIYGKIENVSWVQENVMGTIDPLDSRSCYPESKRMAETIFEAYHNQYGIPYNVLRIAHTYGPGMEIENDGRVMSDFIYYAVNGKDITLNSDGSAKRSFCYITDLIYGIVLILLKGGNKGAYNLSNEKEPYPIRETAQMLIDLFPEKNMKLSYIEATEEIKKGYTNYKLTQMDNSKVERLGWSPMVCLKEGMKRTVDYFEIEQNH